MSLKSKLIIAAFVVLALIVILVRPYYLFITKNLQVSPIKALFSGDSLKTYNDQVSILLLGITPTGSSHEGPNLSDSIIVINYNLKTNRLTTISIPRDIWSETLGDKINSAYAYGEAKKKGSGFILAKAEIEEVVGLPIQYAGVIDFNQFESLINFLGGIDVKVDRTFDDYAFPIPDEKIKDLSCGHSDADIQKFTDSNPSDQEIWNYFPCRYKHVHFDAGMNHMDGATALIFVRSRHATGPEGTDFARDARQQKIIEAVKNKLIPLVKKPDLKTYNRLYEIFNQLIKRDISNQQAAIIVKNILFKMNFSQDKIALSEEFFTNPAISDKYNNLWVLIPKNNNISTIHQYINCNLARQKNCEDLKPKREENSQ
jgi:LCP family protein required for cell wall assembly